MQRSLLFNGADFCRAWRGCALLARHEVHGAGDEFEACTFEPQLHDGGASGQHLCVAVMGVEDILPASLFVLEEVAVAGSRQTSVAGADEGFGLLFPRSEGRRGCRHAHGVVLAAEVVGGIEHVVELAHLDYGRPFGYGCG